MSEKLGPIGEKFIEAIHEKKAETDPDYKGENPQITEDVIKDLKEMGVINIKERIPFTETDAEDIVKVALGKDVFERPDKEIELPKPYIYQEIDRLGKELVEFSKKARETKNMESKKVYEEKAKFFRAELEKAKTMRDKIKLEKPKISEIDEEFRKVREQQRKKREQKPQEIKKEKMTQLQADIRRSQSKTYKGSNIYTKESTPEDAIEKGMRQKEIRRLDKKEG